MTELGGSGAVWALVAGGGTAGHVLPGLAVACELVARGRERASIHFVGAERGLDGAIVPRAGFPITLLPGRGIQRSLNPGSVVENAVAVFGLLRALFGALVLVRRLRPRVVLVTGGFASVACALAAIVWRVPLVVAEQNARASAANRLVARFAKACAVPFADTDLPRAVVTGNPVRPEVLAVAEKRDPVAARRRLGVPEDRTVVAVFAGSLGSRRINEATYGAVSRWSQRNDLAVYHVVGARDWDDRPAEARTAEARTAQAQTAQAAQDGSASGADADPDRAGGSGGGLWYRPVRYEEHMETVLEASDVAVCRAGGTTVAELAVIGVPSVLVPLPIATRDHQTANAAPLVRVGAAVLVPDAEMSTDRMVAEVESITTPNRLSGMAAAARELGRPRAAAEVADLLERHAR